VSIQQHQQPPRRTRAEASRENGRKSRGPITPEGKAISSQNARTHSITASIVCVTNEAKSLFDLLLNGLIADFKPANTVQTELVNELASIRWRQRRLQHIETALLDHAMDTAEPELEKSFSISDESTVLARAFERLANGGNALELLRRYSSTYARQWDRTLANLLELQRLQPPAPVPTHPLPATRPDAAQNLQNEPGKAAPVIPISAFQQSPDVPKNTPNL
jgi:hypothetical protein